MQKPITSLAKLASYDFNIRSFHPEKSFGWSGLNFSGDDRGFSLKPSGSNLVSSRIWHKFTLDTVDGGILHDKTIRMHSGLINLINMMTLP